MEFEKLSKYILDRLKLELPSILYYHSFGHVLDVFQSAQNLAGMEVIDDEELMLLKTAVLFHDSGFMVQLQNHEEAGCKIVKEVLPNYQYSSEQIECICGMIMATKIPQTPLTKLEQIICDADLDYLGRDDFWEIGNNLFKELTELGILKNEEDWNRLQLNFLSKHQYFTDGAKKLRQNKKQEHLIKITNIVESYGK